MFKRFLCATLAMIICSTALINISAFAAATDDTPIYEIVDYYVPKEKETGYDDIRYAEETQKYSDVSEGDNRTINILSALKLTDSLKLEENADDDESTDNADNSDNAGNAEMFKPDEAISRGEFVAMAARLINAQYYSQNDKLWFSDVPRDSRFYSEISGMAAMGIVGGYGDGTFCPDKKISYEETISVMMKALGYGVAAELKGGMSTGYRKTASQIGLTDGLTVKNESEMSRIEAVRLMYNALDCPIYKAVSFGDSVRYETDENCTALSEYHKIYKAEDYVNATLVSALSGYSPTDSEHILVGDLSCRADKNKYAEYLGYYVEMYYKDDGSNEREIVYLAPDEKQEKLVIKADDIASFKNLTYTYGDKNRKVSIGKNHTLIVNGRRMTEYDEDAFIPHNGEVILLSTDSGRYDTVIVNTFHSFLMKSVETNRDGNIVFSSWYSLPSFNIDFNNENQTFLMYIDDKRVDFYAEKKDVYNADGILIHQIVIPDIPKNSVLNIFADKYDTVLGKKIPSEDASYVKIVISTQKVAGKAVSWDNEKISVDTDESKTEYKLSDESILDLNKLDYKLGLSGFYLLDYDGKVFAYSNSDGEDQYIMGGDGKKILVTESNLDVGLVYGYLIKTSLSGVFDGKLDAKILDTNGKINVYSFSEKVMVNGEKLENAKDIDNRLRQSAKLINPTFEISQLLKYKLNNEGKIIEIRTALQSVGKPDSSDKDDISREHERGIFRSRTEYGWALWQTSGEYANVPLYNGEARQFFKVPNEETFNDDDYTVPVGWWPNNTDKLIDIYDADENLIPNVVVMYEQTNDRLYEYPYVMVKSVEQGIDKDGNVVDVLRFVGAAGDPVPDNPYTEEVRRRYPGYEEDTVGGEARFFAETSGMFDGLKCGDLIKIYGKNRYISKWEMVLSLEDAKNYDLSKYPTRAESPREKWDMYEVYSIIESTNRVLMVQKGKITSDSKREYMQLNPYGSVNSIILYDASGREPIVRTCDNPYVLEQARLVGNEAASRVYIWETNVVMKLLVCYVGL